MTGIASLFGLALAVSVVFAIWRISGNVRAIRQHLDRMAEMGLSSNVRAIREHLDRIDRAVAPPKVYSSSAPPMPQAVAETGKPALHEREDAASRAYRAAHPDK